MKNVIRAFTIALTLTGAVASAHTTSSNQISSAKVSAFPIPMCPPSDPTCVIYR